MPDTWEYPWFAAWILPSSVALAAIDPSWLNSSYYCYSNEWYQHPNGKIRDTSRSFRQHQSAHTPLGCAGSRPTNGIAHDREACGLRFSKTAISKVSLNFTWWVAREDSNGNNVFEGGF